MLGLNPDNSLHLTERTFNRSMGLSIVGNTMWMSSMFQLWRFENSLGPGEGFEGYDRIYIPQMAYTTGDLDIHDIIVPEDGKPMFVNTLFSCLARPSETHSFRPVWKPPFISRLAPEDRCHLNGMAARDGAPAYVTAVGKSDTADGWREHRTGGGLVMDVRTDDILAEGLAMPHSPRWHDGRLWILEAGSGYFGYMDLSQGTFEKVAFCPGFLRGLAFSGAYALAGTSSVRKNHTFSGLPLEQNLEKHGAEARCSIRIIHTHTGNTEHWLRLKGMVDELYDVAVVPQCQRPLIIGTQRDEIKKMISIEPER